MDRAENAQVRLAEILQMIEHAGEAGLTRREIEFMSGYNYSTVRNDIERLVQRGKIEMANIAPRENSTVFTLTGVINVPSVRVGKNWIPYTTIVQSAIEGNPGTVLEYTKIIRAALVCIAARAAAGPANPMTFYPERVRSLLIQARDESLLWQKAIDSILDEPKYWNEAQLVDVINTSMFEPDRLMFLANRLLGEL